MAGKDSKMLAMKATIIVRSGLQPAWLVLFLISPFFSQDCIRVLYTVLMVLPHVYNEHNMQDSFRSSYGQRVVLECVICNKLCQSPLEKCLFRCCFFHYRNIMAIYMTNNDTSTINTLDFTFATILCIAIPILLYMH